MPKILFLTYYYSPCNATASNRPNSFTSNFIKNGYEVTLITRHWTGKEKVWTDYLAGDTRPVEIRKDGKLQVHYLPVKAFRYSKALFSTIHTIYQNLKGNFNYELPYGQLEHYVDQLLKQHTYDFILTSTPPLTALKTASHLAKRFNIPLIADIRDFENDVLLYKERNHTLFRQLQHKLLMRYLRKWMKQSDIICTASPPLTNYINLTLSKNAFTLLNGFNEELLLLNEPQSKDWFIITVTGTLYEFANLKVMLDCCSRITTRHPEVKIKFQFIGLMANERVAMMFKQIIPPENLVLTHRVSQIEALKIASSSHVLMLAGFDEMKGAYTTKIFEYLGLRRNIIQIPGDRDVVEDLIIDTQTGKVPHTAEEAYAFIMTWYEEWSDKGQLAYFGDMQRILRYSREKQFEKLLKRLKR